MSKHGPCNLSRCNEPAIAWWKSGNGAHTLLCQRCLDWWFDNADDDDTLEPTGWGWLYRPASPALPDVAAWASDPSNHRAVAAVLRVEARINPGWLREFIARENRTQGHRLARV